MKAIASFFAKIIASIVGAKDPITKALNTALSALPSAFPFIQIVASLTPTQYDDVALAAVKAAYPRLFETGLTEDERKLYLLAVASELLRAKLPGLSVTISRICVQIAYLCNKLGGWIAAKE